MVEPIMYLAIGFLLSMLCGLAVVPLVHNRAVRLTTRRLEAATPLSMAEIQADKDQLRAEFAMSARRLEMNVEQLKNKTTSQLAELGKKSDAINRMKIELGEKNATIFALEAREKAVKEQLRATEEEFAAKTTSLREAEMLSGRVTDLEGRLATQGKLLAERDYENNLLRQANENAERTVKQLREEIASMIDGKSPAVEKLRAEKAAAEEQLRIARDERAKLQRDINAIQQRAENSWATERMENALLRERINDIAAEVAKLAMQLEGPHSAIDAILGDEQAAKPAAKAANGATASAASSAPGGTLAERIRALQAHASRARQQGA